MASGGEVMVSSVRPLAKMLHMSPVMQVNSNCADSVKLLLLYSATNETCLKVSLNLPDASHTMENLSSWIAGSSRPNPSLWEISPPVMGELVLPRSLSAILGQF